MVTQQAFYAKSGVREISSKLASAASVVMLAAPGSGYTHRLYGVAYTYNGTVSALSLRFGATDHFVMSMGPVSTAPATVRFVISPPGLDVGDDLALTFAGTPDPDAGGAYCTVVYETVLLSSAGRQPSTLREVSGNLSGTTSMNLLAAPGAGNFYKLHGVVLAYGGTARDISLRYGAVTTDHFKTKLGPVLTEITSQEFWIPPPGVQLSSNQALKLVASGLPAAPGVYASVVYELVRTV